MLRRRQEVLKGDRRALLQCHLRNGQFVKTLIDIYFGHFTDTETTKPVFLFVDGNIAIRLIAIRQNDCLDYLTYPACAVIDKTD